jgi:metal-dependent amidase/aminoacylase/carboxypeptidase family protein
MLTQQMVDSVFSFGELGFQEFETGGKSLAKTS